MRMEFDNRTIKDLYNAILCINKLVAPHSTILNNNITSSLSSYGYYNSIELQISSIVRDIIKNHHFSDGNKRTAFMMFIYLTDVGNIKLKNKRYEDIILEIANNKYSVEKVCELLFK